MASPIIIEAAEMLSKATKKKSQKVQSLQCLTSMLSRHPNLTHTKGNGGARIPDALEVLRITEATSATEVTTTKTLRYKCGHTKDLGRSGS